MRSLTLLTFLLACQSDLQTLEPTTQDAGNKIDIKPTDNRLTTDSSEPDSKPANFKCSPVGTFTFFCSINSSNCDPEVVPDKDWKSVTTQSNSLNCGTYWWDEYSTHKLFPNLWILCDYYFEAYPHYYSAEVKCKIYEDGVSLLCDFSYNCTTVLKEPN